jgi:hypothetical protein
MMVQASDKPPIDSPTNQSLPEVMWLGSAVHHSLLPSAKIKNMWSHKPVYTPPNVFVAC